MVYEEKKEGGNGAKKDLAEILFFFPYRDSTLPYLQTLPYRHFLL